jgi:hypothetical protein
MTTTTITTKPERRTQGSKWIARTTRLAIYLRDGLACCYCGASVEDGAQLTLDHLTPYSKGGSHKPTNLATCCGQCNSVRQDRPWTRFAEDCAQYLGIDKSEVVRHINNCRRRQLPRKEARQIIARRGSWAQVLENDYR